MVERVWLTHPQVPGSAWHCPADAADDWRERGWVDGQPPVEINPAVAERIAARAAAQQQAQKPGRKGGAETSIKES